MEAIDAKPALNQGDLVELLRLQGIRTTQSTVSRDLAELGALKVNGAYRLPESRSGQGGVLGLTAVEPVGDHWIVLRTPVGQASPVALRIDRAGIQEVVGTVAGDDTIMVAVKGPAQQRKAVKEIVALFSPRG